MKITREHQTFEVVDEIPYGYMIWNIGKHMVDGYLPLCRLAERQPFPGGRSINVNTLKAIKCDGAQTILAVTTYGQGTIKEMEEFLTKYKGTRNPDKQSHMKQVEAALLVLRNVKGAENLI